MPKNRFLWGWS